MPINKLTQWLNKENSVGAPNPAQAVLATSTIDAIPHGRVVAIREISPEGLLFFTQKGTKKIEELNDDQLNDWMMPLIGAFESTFEICSIYGTTHEKAFKRNINLRHFSLYKQEKPIASITLSMHDNTIARIDDVGALPEFQGKEYASALMRYVLSEAKRLGAHHCFLESSDSGLGIYQKLGFEPLFKNNIYSR